MIKIGLLSDTHSYLDPQIKILFKDVDEIWHAGDIGDIALADELKRFKPLRAVYGNIDDKTIRTEYEEDLFFELEKLKILITHIGGYPNNYAPKAKKLIEELRPTIFVCGHSHILRVMRDVKYNNMLVLNPGAAGIHGFHKVKTVLRFTLDNGKVTQMEAIEIGKRGDLNSVVS